jgi:cobalamin biosynthesis Mg chelatase CobN
MQPEQPNSVTPVPAPTQPVDEASTNTEAEAPKSAPDVAIQQAPGTQDNGAEQQTSPAASPSKQASKQTSGVNVPMIVAIVIGILLIATTVVAYTQG